MKTVQLHCDVSDFGFTHTLAHTHVQFGHLQLTQPAKHQHIQAICHDVYQVIPMKSLP